MARFYFDVRQDGKIAPDDEGMILPDIEAVKREAVLSLAEMAREAIRSDWETDAPHELAIQAQADEQLILEAKIAFEVSQRR
jgi:hypothetical protein